MSILLLHTSNASRRRHLARARDYAHDHGERLIVVVRNPTWEGEFADLVVDADTTSIAATREAVKALLATEREEVTAVTTLVEHSVPAAAAVAADLGMRYISPETAYLARDKFRMREAFEASGVPQPRFAMARTTAEALRVAGEVGFPLVMKPLIGGGSMYVRRADGPDDITQHFEHIRKGAWDGFDYDPLYRDAVEAYGGAILLESYVPGGEVSVESIVVDGETHVIAIHDKPLPMIGPFFEEVFFATPTTLPSDTVEQIVAATTSAHQALGINVGATHTEFRITDELRPVMLEQAARLGGAAVYQSVLLSTGVDMVAAVLDVASGRTPQLEIALKPRAVGHYLYFADKAGVITQIHGVDEALADPRVSDLETYRKPGDFANVPPHVWQAHGHVIFSADSRDDLHQTLEWLRKTIRIDVR